MERAILCPPCQRGSCLGSVPLIPRRLDQGHPDSGDTLGSKVDITAPRRVSFCQEITAYVSLSRLDRETSHRLLGVIPPRRTA